MKNKAITLLALASMTVAATSCSKGEGEGGDASIQGRVCLVTDNGDIQKDPATGIYTFQRDTLMAAGKNVYIVYGGGLTGHDDKTETDANGIYSFRYLRKGDYTIYTLSDSSAGKVGAFRNINIGSEGGYHVDRIYINDGKNSGCAGIVGKITATYAKNSTPLPGVGIRVYLKDEKGGSENDTRANDLGEFHFSRLAPFTKYIIYAETEPVKNAGIFVETTSVTTGASGSIIDITAQPLSVYVN